MKKLLFIPILLIALQVNAQSFQWNPVKGYQSIQITASPYSIQLWGQTPGAQKLAVRWGIFEAVYIHTFKTMYAVTGHGYLFGIHRKGFRTMKINEYHGSYFALFILPIRFNWNQFHIQAGMGWFFGRGFPTKGLAQLNFTLQLSYMITDRIGIAYQHISNGFRLIHHCANPGLDNISIKIKI